jgi:hypothetical protein
MIIWMFLTWIDYVADVYKLNSCVLLDAAGGRCNSQTMLAMNVLLFHELRETESCNAE